MVVGNTSYEIIGFACMFALCVTIQGYIKAYVSTKYGDPTPKINGRLSLNPLVHLDLLGFLTALITGWGRGKQIKINGGHYQNTGKIPRKVLLSGIYTSCAASLLCLSLYISIAGISGIDIRFSSSSPRLSSALFMAAVVNIRLAIINILPLRPLDGWKIIQTHLPQFHNRIRKRKKVLLIIFVSGILFVPLFRTLIENTLGSLANLFLSIIQIVRTIILL